MFLYSTYGFLIKGIEPLAAELAALLQLEWQVRESDYYGAYYRYPPYDQKQARELYERFTLYNNRNVHWTDGWNETRFKKCRVILAVTTERLLDIDMLLFPAYPNKVIVLHRSAPRTPAEPPKTDAL